MPVAEISRCGNQYVGLARFLILNSFKLLDVYLLITGWMGKIMGGYTRPIWQSEVIFLNYTLASKKSYDR